ncbi:MAG TPA: hypothetical protein VFE06_12700 [Acidobacteriaceae bacterium]|jgi:hypothetical protein|nr:hypothetical protein [Acidobacteriaceae bacterium]
MPDLARDPQNAGRRYIVQPVACLTLQIIVWKSNNPTVTSRDLTEAHTNEPSSYPEWGKDPRKFPIYNSFSPSRSPLISGLRRKTSAESQQYSALPPITAQSQISAASDGLPVENSSSPFGHVPTAFGSKTVDAYVKFAFWRTF